jgi:anti-sigma factor RsiW
MLKHVTAEQIEQYRNKAMPPGELLAFDRHVAQCAECRDQLAYGESVSKLVAGLVSAAAAPEHLSYEQMVAYVDSNSDDTDREIVESHVEMCARCATELGDLAAFAERMAAETEPGPMASHREGLGEISLPRKIVVRAGEDDEKKTR